MSVLRLGGKRAITLWQKVEEIANEFSLLSVSPKTGRTHQIRVHLSHMGHPIVGDPVYGHKKTWWKKHLPSTPDISTRIKRQMLHSEILGFIHPDSEKYREFGAPMPGDMARVLKTLRLVGIRNKKT
jgi:23S rRNA pseudouridine1911/1915/1917 synthase